VTDIDIARLESMQTFEDPRIGVRERFLTPALAGERTVAVLSTPTAPPESLGWVVCQSFGPEQDLLMGLEVPIVRALTVAGYPVLRYHARGYGDNAFPADLVNVTTHLEDALEAAEVLRANSDVQQVGFAGAYFGAAVAALAADRHSASIPATALALWEPAVRGRDYIRNLLRLGLMTELIAQGRRGGAPEPTEILRERGVLDVVGFPLRQEVYDEISRLDLTKDLRAFRGDSLIVQLSKSSRPRSDVQRLSARLTELGGDVSFEVVNRPDAHKLRRPRFHGMGDGTKVDAQEGLVTSLVDTTLAWNRKLANRKSSGGTE
jgi:hypothetical protein